jgi:hypothetical protein
MTIPQLALNISLTSELEKNSVRAIFQEKPSKQNADKDRGLRQVLYFIEVKSVGQMFSHSL